MVYKNLINLVKKDLAVTKYVAPFAIFFMTTILSADLLFCYEESEFFIVTLAMILFETISIAQYFGADFYFLLKI
jgi:hypothetical protein